MSGESTALTCGSDSGLMGGGAAGCGTPYMYCGLYCGSKGERKEGTLVLFFGKLDVT